MTGDDEDSGPEVQVAGPSPQASGTWLGWGPAVLHRDLPTVQGLDRRCPSGPSGAMMGSACGAEIHRECPQGCLAPGA